MRRLRWILIGAFLASTSCQPEGTGLIESGEPGTLALSITGSALSTVPPTTWQARITGNGVDLTRSGNSGQSVSLTLNPGTYAVSMAGLAQGGVVLFGERDGLVVTAGGETPVTVPVTSFVPATINAPTATTTGQSITVSWAPVPGASSGYEVESSPSAAFTQGVDRTTTTQTSVTMTPSQPGTYYFRVRAQPNGRVSAAGYWSEATAGTVVAGSAPTITTPSPLPQGIVGTAYSLSFQVSGGQAPHAWTHSGSLPPGLSLSSGGVLTGTPTAAGAFSFSVQVTDSNGLTSNRSFNLTISPAPVAPTINTNSTLPQGTVGIDYSLTFQVAGGQAPYTWTHSTALPSGLSLSSDGVLTGTPTAAGTFSFSVQVTDSNGLNSSRSFGLAISPTPPIPTITTPSPLPQGAVGTAYSLTFQASGGQGPYTWTRSSGSLPAGLSLSSGGVLSGTPSASGTFDFSVRVTGSDGLDSARSFRLTISDAPLVTLTVHRGTQGSGGIASDPAGIDIPRGYTQETREMTVPQGATVTLMVVDSVGFVHVWLNESGQELCPLNATSCSFVMQDNLHFHIWGQYQDANFMLRNMHGGGSLVANYPPLPWLRLPDGGRYGPDRLFGWVGAYLPIHFLLSTSATADPGWRFVGWDGECAHSATVCTFPVPRGGGTSVSGYFEPVPYPPYSVDDLWPSFDQPLDFDFTVPAGSTEVQSGEVTFNLSPRLGIGPVTYDAPSASWLTVQQVGVQGEQVTIRIQAAPAGLATGTHVATARLWSYRAREFYQDVTVTLRVQP